MVLPAVTYAGLDLPIEAPPLLGVMVVFVGTPFVMAALGWMLARVAVKRFGRPWVEGINAGVMLIALALAGGAAGYVLSDGNAAISVLFGTGLLVANALVVYSRREYMFGTVPTDAIDEPVDRPSSETNEGY